MSYTRPPFDAADASWEGAEAYTRLPHDAADAAWAIAPAIATMAATVPVTAAISANHTNALRVGVLAASVPVSVAFVGRHGVGGTLSASVAVQAHVDARRGARGALAAGVPVTAAFTGAEAVAVAWPVVVQSGLPWFVEVVVQSYDVALPWRVKVGAESQTQAGWPVAVLPASVVGGLNGAGGWSAAPSGRWAAAVVLGESDDISARLTGVVRVEIADDAARTAEFSFLPAAPIQPMALTGRRVRIAFAQAGGLNAQTIFRGVVDVPRIDLQTRVITCTCHDQAQEVAAAMPRESIDALVGGRWHVAVSGEPEDGFDYLRERILSVPRSWALDADQALRLLPWRDLPRSITVRTADVVSGSLEVDLPSREQLRTRVVVRLQYRYPVHRARAITAQWAQDINFFKPSTVTVPQKPEYLFLTVSMVQGAAARPPGWSLVRELDIEHPTPGSYPVGPSPTDGVYGISPRVARDLALGFRGLYTTRWQQMVTEDYTVRVVWQALENQLGGEVPEEAGATLESRFDVPEWSSDESVAPLPDPIGPGDILVPWRAPGADEPDRDDVLRTLLDRAWVRLYAASRSGRVRFDLPCRPDLWLDVWCALEHEALRAAGKVTELAHVLDLDTGEAITGVALAVGLPGDEGAALPDWELPTAQYTPESPNLAALSAEIGTFVGGLLDSPPWDEETMVGFATNAEGPVFESREYYPHQFSIGWPAIDAADRDPVTVAADVTLPVSVPTDLLETTP